jgi:hypothetical protein
MAVIVGHVQLIESGDGKLLRIEHSGGGARRVQGIRSLIGAFLADRVGPQAGTDG